jgi:Tfp pilus assembly protein PilE
MRSRQRGATAIGMIIIVAIIGCGIYAGIRLLPVYFEYMAVVRILEQTAKENSGGTMDQLRNSLNRRWSVEDVKSVSYKEIDIKRNGGGYSMRAWYRAEVPFVANVSLVADFDKTVMVGGARAGL